MVAEPVRRQFTVDEYHQMGMAGVFDPEERVELIGGAIIQMLPIAPAHAACADRLADVLITRFRERVQVRVQNPLSLAPLSEPVPDVALLHRRADFYRAHHPTAADAFLVIEVSDTSLRYDRHVKMLLYARQGVPEAWIVDLRGAAVLTFREPSADGFRVAETKRRGDRLSVQALPELSITVDEVLGEP